VLIIIGHQVCLRQFGDSDLAWWRRALAQRAWARWDAPWEAPLSRAELKAMVERARTVARQRTLPPNRMIIETRSGRPIGTVTRYWVDARTEWLEVGIGIYSTRQRGRGHGTEAFALWIDYLFEALDLRRIGFRTWSGNARMMRLARRLGFRQEATFREAYATPTRRYDRVAFGLLRREWIRARRRWPVTA
jgi:RimJ/RimL family protein N-acetyltransferase